MYPLLFVLFYILVLNQNRHLSRAKHAYSSIQVSKFMEFGIHVGFKIRKAFSHMSIWLLETDFRYRWIRWSGSPLYLVFLKMQNLFFLFEICYSRHRKCFLSKITLHAFLMFVRAKKQSQNYSPCFFNVCKS